MNQDLDFLTVIRRHFPIFIGGFFLGLFSLTACQILLLELYPPATDDFGLYLMAGSVGISLYLCAGNFLLVRGRPWAVWSVVAAMLVCLLLALLHWGGRAPRLMLFSALLLPLATLLLLNSRRYRDMLVAMRCLRDLRADWRQRQRRH